MSMLRQSRKGSWSLVDASVRSKVAQALVWMLGVSASAIAAAPLLMPDSYSWVENTISESGGQGVHGAWLARSGVFLTALAALGMARLAGERWGWLARSSFRFYSMALMASAIFARAPWLDVPYDKVEAFLHTFSTFWAGVGFALGVLAVSFRRQPGQRFVRGYDLVVVLATPAVALLMLAFQPYGGVLQRSLAVVGYAWLLSEAVRVRRDAQILPL